MAKGKERPTAPTGMSKSGGGSRSPAKPMQAKGPTKTESRGHSAAKLSAEEVYRLIQESAYFKAKARGFAPGHEVQDWIEAEAEVRRRLEDRAA